jgi:molybdopterin converting factor small subunit
VITVTCLGHIKSSVGKERVAFDVDEIDSAELIETLRTMSSRAEPGFTKYNTLVMVGTGEAFLPAAASKKLKSGDEVVLIPFSHGG